ncbi:MAG: hypothetical protein N3G78_02735 [Desulfobacterota bacterium]|nr:hypothetical protein [Thermodesulfobacteriota bacterium]
MKRKAIPPQGFFSLHIIELLKVGHDQFSQGPVNRLSKPQSYKIGFGHRPPMAISLIKGKQMIVVSAVGDHLQEERGMAEPPEETGGKEGPIKTMGHPLSQDPQRTAVDGLRTIRNVIEKGLDLCRIGQGL